jgi:hypothetical protein
MNEPQGPQAASAFDGIALLILGRYLKEFAAQLTSQHTAEFALSDARIAVQKEIYTL